MQGFAIGLDRNHLGLDDDEKGGKIFGDEELSLRACLQAPHARVKGERCGGLIAVFTGPTCLAAA